MWSKYLKISVFIVLMILMIINISVSISPKAKSASLKILNIEALASTESGSEGHPCVEAKGFCFVNGIRINEIAIKE